MWLAESWNWQFHPQLQPPASPTWRVCRAAFGRAITFPIPPLGPATGKQNGNELWIQIFRLATAIKNGGKLDKKCSLFCISWMKEKILENEKEKSRSPFVFHAAEKVIKWMLRMLPPCHKLEFKLSDYYYLQRSGGGHSLRFRFRPWLRIWISQHWFRRHPQHNSNAITPISGCSESVPKATATATAIPLGSTWTSNLTPDVFSTMFPNLTPLPPWTSTPTVAQISTPNRKKSISVQLRLRF